ncbi:MAG: tRNA (N6-isopentenyl adenosine(37)-C2)-methylthiotransferase MiaB [Bacteroidales bacterium]|nr:tRNA (N6-isopentenyl adenosine(37)-C2)-methylthiotransferase MiaB [Bacteroidales bacterium]
MTNKYSSVKPVLNSEVPQVFIETYGCQMNVNDSEVVLAMLQQAGYSLCDSINKANVILVNTCSIRDNAEQRIWGRLDVFLQEKKKRKDVVVGVLGCMAERLKDELLKHSAVDIVAGPDTYRDIAKLLDGLRSGEKQINTMLSAEETYADISPVRMDKNGVSAFVSIMRGCNNMCSYCVVPYTRGRERSRDPHSIVREAQELFNNGYKEITLLGQNVDSYKWVNKENPSEEVNFAQLLELVALISPQLRVRFSTSHPKDMGNGVLYTMAMYPNICNHIHLPVQSGSDVMLEKMNRKYDRAKYLERVQKIREILPDCAISTDIIAGFCGETLEDHMDTLSIMKEVRYDSAFMFQYSMRPNTKAWRHFTDDVPLEEKTRRLNEIIELQNSLALEANQKCLGKEYEVLIEGTSKRDKNQLIGRTQQNKVCVFDGKGHKIGDYVTVKVNSCTSATLLAEIVEKKERRKLFNI